MKLDKEFTTEAERDAWDMLNDIVTTLSSIEDEALAWGYFPSDIKVSLSCALDLMWRHIDNRH